jgi:hypothetical protein
MTHFLVNTLNTIHLKMEQFFSLDSRLRGNDGYIYRQSGAV